MKKEEIPFLNQLVDSLEEAKQELEKNYKKKDIEKFNKSKKMILEIQEKIDAIVNSK